MQPNQNDTLQSKPCQCSGIMDQVINAEERLRKGWYCPSCKAWEDAILRERVWKIEEAG